jgi:hypothetical protein
MTLNSQLNKDMNMNKLITLLGLLTGLTAHAQLPAQTNQFIPQENFASKNPGFEQGKNGWTASAGTFSITSSSSNVAQGGFAGSMDFSTTGQTLSLAAKTIPSGLFAQNCLAEMKLKGFDANVTAEVYDGTNVIASQVLSAYSTFNLISIPFVCPSSGTFTVRLKSSADAAIGYIDSVFLGQNYRVGTVAQAKLIGTLKYTGAASCVWSGTSASFSNYSADTDCGTPTVTGSVSAPGTKIPAFVLANVEPGSYKITVSSAMSAANGSGCKWRIHDGTNGSEMITEQYTNAGHFTRAGQLSAVMTYTAAQGSTTFNLQHFKYAGSSCDLETDTTNGGNNLVFTVEKLPSASEIVYAPNMQAAYAEVKIALGASRSTNTSATTFTTLNNTNLTAGRTNKGVCLDPTTAGDIGCKISKLPAGKYLINVTGEALMSGGAAAQYRAYEIVSGASTKGSYANQIGGQGVIPSFGVLEITSEITNANIVVQALREGGSNAGFDITNYDFSMQIIPIEQGIPMPTVINSVQTGYAGQMRMETAFITNNGSSCVVSEEYGDWIASPTRGGTGNCAIPFNTAFSQNPHCVGSIYQAVGMNLRIQAISTSSVTIETFNSGGANTDQNSQLICFGPK